MKTTLQWTIAQKAELKWWQNYLRNRPKADYLAWKKQYWQGVLQNIADVLPCEQLNSSRLLDAGCGPAGIFIALPPQARITALDPLLEHYAQRLSHFSPASYPHIQFMAMPIEKMPAHPSYDVVFCLNAINHVSDLNTCLDKLTQALVPDGQLVISIDTHNYTPIKHLFRWLPADILHPHQYTLSEYTQMLEQRGMHLQKSVRTQKGIIFSYDILVFCKN